MIKNLKICYKGKNTANLAIETFGENVSMMSPSKIVTFTP